MRPRAHRNTGGWPPIWLATVLRACTLAIQHDPVFDWRPWQKWVDQYDETPNCGSSGKDHLPMWEPMDEAGVDALLVGHNHLYQRWAPQDVAGNYDRNGIRQFTRADQRALAVPAWKEAASR